MPHPTTVIRPRPSGFLSLRAAALGPLLALLAIGCKEPSPTDGGHQIAIGAAAAVANSGSSAAAAVIGATGPAIDPASTVAAAVQPSQPAASKAAAQPTVWVILKSQANATAAATTSKDWKGKGQAVFNALTTTASTSQAGLIGLLRSRAATFKPFWILNAIKVTADQQTIDEIAKRSDVASVIPDKTFHIPPVQQNAQGISATEWNLDNIQAPDVWNQFGARGDGIVVANIDTGVQYDHPALVRQYRGNNGDGTFDHNYNWFDPANVCGFPSTTPCDNVFHGTHTMGTMVGDDGAGNQIGVAPAARWIAAKGCESNSCTTESLLAAGQWVLAPTDLNGQNPRPDLRPHIVNNSWAGGSGDPFFQSTVQAWVAAGIFPAFANGNSGPGCGSAASPGDYPESYGVGAYDIGNTIASFSSRGASVLGPIKPNISAPGVSVRSSVPGNGYDIFSGTSMATPHVAGAVALLWSASAVLLGDVAGTRALLDQTAVDTDDTSCGGTPGNNNTYGQGRLNILSTMNQAPIGPSGTLQGTVTAASGGGPIAKALVHLQGPADRTTVTDGTGAYHLRLPEGTYTLTISAFGEQTRTITGIAIVKDTTVTEDVALVAVPSFRLSGTVLDDTGRPVVGAQVSIVGTPLPIATADATGQYEFASVPQGTYDVTASAPGNCYSPATTSVTISADTTLPFTLPLRADGFGYVCRLTATDYIPANTPTGLFGDFSTVTLPLPFEFGFYNGKYASVNVATNGFVNFIPATTFFGNIGIPDPTDPNAAIFALWNNIFVDGSSGTVTTDTVGTAPNRKFIIEWRNVLLFENPAWPVSFELQLGEDGSIVSRYESAGPDPFQRGATASVGIEDETGTTGLQFSFDQPVLSGDLAIAYTLPPSGFVRGTVTDANDGTAIAGATVRARQGTKVVVREVHTDASGNYVMHVPVGSYKVEATAKNYSVETASVSIGLNADLTTSFKLKTARAVLSPSTLQLTVPPNQTRTRVLTLSNTGSSSLSFTVNESGGAKQTTVSTLRLARNTVTTPNARDARGLFAPGVAATGMKPLAAGDVLKSFAPTGVGFAWGVGYTSKVWLSDITTPFRDVEFSTDGVATGRQFSTPWVSGFGADMAYVSGKNLLCQLNVGGDNGIYCMDPATGTVVTTIAGAFQWTNTSQRGLAYRSDDDSFYVAGWNEGIVYHIAGLSAAQPGQVLGTCMPADGIISGLAYNPAAGVLWAATNTPTDTIYELNPTDCTVLSTLAPPQVGGFQGAGLEMDEAGNLWMIAQSPNRAYLVDSGVPAFNDVPWSSESPVTGTVAVGKSQKITVTINTAGLSPGLYLGTLYVGTSAARQQQLRVPVSLYVPDYQQAVNSGDGGAYTDTLGDKWAADQKYTTGNWGYVQKSKGDSTSKTITGTADPKLFQTQRVDPYGYRFDNVPNGTYQVELELAELNAKEKIGKRLFDVIVEDTVILPAHDIVYQVGTLAAESRTFFLNITDGQMDLRLIPRAGSDLPVINAARITHRLDR